MITRYIMHPGVCNSVEYMDAGECLTVPPINLGITPDKLENAVGSAAKEIKIRLFLAAPHCGDPRSTVGWDHLPTYRYNINMVDYR